MDGNVINYSQIDRHKEALENTSKNKEQEQEKKSRIDLLRSLAKNTQSESEGHTVDGRIKNGPSSSDTKSSGDASTSHEASDREVQISAQPKERRQKIEKMMQEFAHIDKQYQQM